MLLEYVAHVARRKRDFPKAEATQTLRVNWERERCADALIEQLHNLNADQRYRMRFLAGALHGLGQILREQKRKECIDYYSEAHSLSVQLGTCDLSATIAINLGHAYREIPEVRDYYAAECWYKTSLEVMDESDFVGRSHVLCALGYVAWDRFHEAMAAIQSDKDLKASVHDSIGHLDQAARSYHAALELVPPQDLPGLAVVHGQLGNIYADMGNLPTALNHWRKSLQCAEKAGDTYGAGKTRYNVAVHLMRDGPLADAFQYAHSALRDFKAYGVGAAVDTADAQRLIQDIECKIG